MTPSPESPVSPVSSDLRAVPERRESPEASGLSNGPATLYLSGATLPGGPALTVVDQGSLVQKLAAAEALVAQGTSALVVLSDAETTVVPSVLPLLSAKEIKIVVGGAGAYTIAWRLLASRHPIITSSQLEAIQEQEAAVRQSTADRSTFTGSAPTSPNAAGRRSADAASSRPAHLPSIFSPKRGVDPSLPVALDEEEIADESTT